jgi:hypothetical protein
MKPMDRLLEAKKPKTVEEILAIWEKQPGARVSNAERQFIRDMRKAADNRVGYGWMKQVIDWEWRCKYPEAFPDAKAEIERIKSLVGSEKGKSGDADGR